MNGDSSDVCNVQPGKRRVGTHKIGAKLVQALHLFSDVFHASKRIGDHGTDPQRVFPLQLQPGVE